MMTTSKFISVSMALIAIVFLAGCASGPNYGGAYFLNDQTVTKYHSQNYTVLGPVSASGRAVMVLGLFVSGHEGEGLLWTDARNKYGEKVTGIKDISAAGDWLSILGFFYAERMTTYSGIAVQEGKQ